MNPRQAELSYRRMAVENASSVGLVVILYDLLVNDLRLAIQALERGDVAGRSTAVKHAFLVLQQLQGSLNREKGGEAAKHLSHFYTVLRGKIWEAHVKRSDEIFREQIRLLLDVRQAWDQVDPARSPAEAIPAPARQSDAQARIGADDEKATADWTA
jgi:flagellar secretion chaperone FliS